MQIRFLEYLIALAQEQHFARAADQCHVSQPTLSSGIVALEEQLGRRLVERDRRFVGLTAEGAAILPWARQLVAAYHSMTAAAGAARGPLTGILRLGVIPAAMPMVGSLAFSLQSLHPALDLDVVSLSSRAMLRAMAAFEIEAGLTYVDHEAPTNVVSVPLYTEHLLFVTSAAADSPRGPGIALPAALDQPLCLLHDGMQNRRILDEHLARAGLTARPRATADSYEALIAMLSSGLYATILPDSYARLLPSSVETRPFDPPLVSAQVGLIVPDRTPLSLMAEAAIDAARTLALPHGLLHAPDRR